MEAIFIFNIYKVLKLQKLFVCMFPFLSSLIKDIQVIFSKKQPKFRETCYKKISSYIWPLGSYVWPTISKVVLKKNYTITKWGLSQDGSVYTNEVTEDINKLKNKNHMIVLVDAEKAWQNSTPFHDKNSKHRPCMTSPQLTLYSTVKT